MSQQSIVEQVFGLTDQDDRGRSAYEAYYTITGERQLSTPPDLQTQVERLADIREISDYILQREPTHATTLSEWHTYYSMMEQYGTRADGNATALMIGSLSALSSRSFVCLAQTVYGAGNAIIVDPKGGTDKIRHGTFIRDSGLQLPLPAASVDFVHTNRLLGALVDPDTPDRPYAENELRLFSQIATVLRPGGQLCMNELPHDLPEDLPLETALEATTIMRPMVALILADLGFEQIEVEHAAAYDAYDHLYDRNLNFRTYPTAGISAGALNIYARKL